jgi:hypothetical protein
MTYIPEISHFSILLQDPQLPNYQPNIQPDNLSSEPVLQRNKETPNELEEWLKID